MQKVNERDCAFRGGDWGVKYFMRGPKLDWGLILLKPGQTMGEHGHKGDRGNFLRPRGDADLDRGRPKDPDRAGRRFPPGSRRSGTTSATKPRKSRG